MRKLVKKLRIGLISFASEPKLVLTLKESIVVDNKEIIERLNDIKFTGSNTRIADAVELALSEFEMGGRRDSNKILILISDGHGQEFWSRAQAVGRRLQQTPSLLSFAVSASQDSNFPELLLYIGNNKRIFVGKSHKEFVSTFSSILNNCLNLKIGKENEDKEEEKEKDILTNGSKNKFNGIFTNLSKIVEEHTSNFNNLRNFSLGNNLERRQKDEPLENENEDNLNDNEGHEEKQKMANNKNPLQIPTSTPSLLDDCPTDLLFVIDSFNAANGISSPFEKQLALAVQLVGRLPSTDVDLGRIRLAALSFGREPRLEARWSEHLGKLEFQRKLRNIIPTKVQSSFASAVNLTLQEINIQRRQSARLLMFILWSGSNGRNTAEELSKSFKPFNNLSKSELFAVAVTPSAQLTRLKTLVGDQWHVFIDARAKQFVEQVSKILLECVLPPSGRHESKGDLLDSHEPINSVERVEHLQLAAKALQKESPLHCENDPIDLIILLNADSNQTSAEQFDDFKRAAKDTIRQAPPEQFQQRIRVTIWSGNPLQKQEPLTLDDALFAIDRIDWPTNDEILGNKFTNKSLTEVLGYALTETFKFGRGDVARSAIVLLTDGYSSEKNGNNKKLQKALESQTTAIFGLNFGNLKFNENIQNQISISNTFSSKPSFLRLFNARGHGQMAKFVDEFQRRIIRCRDEMKIRRADSVLINKNNFGGIKRQRDLRFRNENSDGKISQIQRDSPQPLNNNFDCKSDLIFVIDTSQSVEEEFREQLDLVLELISRLPNKNFENGNIQIGAVSFHRNSLLHFSIGEIKEKNKIFEAISNIQHTGGSTSAVSGINLALEQIEKKRRFDAGQIIVLVSDGNSQDPWGDVVATAGRLEVSGVEVFAVTVSHDHFFRELELLAGNEMKVYINARTKQFFEDIEKILICNKNTLKLSETINNKNQNLTKLEAISDFPFKRLINTNTLQSEQKQNFPISLSSTISPPLIISQTTTTFSSSTFFPTLFKNSETSTITSQLISRTTSTSTSVNDYTSTSVEKDFVAQKKFALDLISILPEQDFNKRLSISLIIFNKKAILQFPFVIGRKQNDILKEIEIVEHTGGPTSLVAASETALEEISRGHRSNARLIIILITDGHSQDEWSKVQIASQKLRNTTNELYAISFSDNFAQNELLEYIKNPKRIYTDRGSDELFLKEVGQSVVGCLGREEGSLTEINTDNNLIKPAKALAGIVQKTRILELNEEENDDRFERDEEVKSVQISGNNGNNNEKNILANCSFSKMDLVDNNFGCFFFKRKCI
uniref:VWFA domain-containing protein n=1 Tax=Meloidogyne incognita TaxID=6306 RepID=A0A914NBP8_MELIC